MATMEDEQVVRKWYKSWATMRGVVTQTSECTSKTVEWELVFTSTVDLMALKLHSILNDVYFSPSNLAQAP